MDGETGRDSICNPIVPTIYKSTRKETELDEFSFFDETKWAGIEGRGSKFPFHCTFEVWCNDKFYFQTSSPEGKGIGERQLGKCTTKYTHSQGRSNVLSAISSNGSPTSLSLTDKQTDTLGKASNSI